MSCGPTSKYTIGDVLFRDIQGQRVPMLLGDPRVAMLRRFYQKRDLGNFEPYVIWVGAITWDDVVWASAGEAVTNGCEVRPPQSKGPPLNA